MKPPRESPEREHFRNDFPLLSGVGGRALHYLDNAATSHKPQRVIEAISACYRNYCAPVHRGLYPLAERATAQYEQARAELAAFIGAASAQQVVFTRSATEAINMVAQGWARNRLTAGDRVYVTRMEHHSNFLPWQRVCRETGAQLHIIELTSDSTLDLDATPELFGPRTRLIALCHVSNVLGVINPVDKIVSAAAGRGIAVLLDAAQSAGHLPLDAAALGCDFLALSAHKMYGPHGIGLLCAKPERLEEMEPLLLGGGMVDSVGERDSLWAPVPAKFEAGSPNLAGAVGFAAAASYINGIGLPVIRHHVETLTGIALDALRQTAGVEIYGPREAARRSGIISFNLRGVHPHDLAQTASEFGVAIRAGHHCCQPLMTHLGVAATARASFALYNTRDDIPPLLDAIEQAHRLFA